MTYTKAKYKLVYGVGKNDVPENIYSVIDGKIAMCKVYKCWSNMIGRCYSPNVQRTRQNYIGCKVDERWHLFSCFSEWMQQQDWRGKDLDKDLIGNGKLYSPENCIFVTHEVNAFIVLGPAKRKALPVGVSIFRNGKFKAYIRDSKKGLRHLGYYDTPSEARSAWTRAKVEQAIDLASRQEDPRVAKGLLEFAMRLNN